MIICFCLFFFFKQKTAYEMRISDWSSDVCSSDLIAFGIAETVRKYARRQNGDDAEGPGGHHAHADQREHVEVHGPERIPAAHEKRPAAPEHCRGDRKSVV